MTDATGRRRPLLYLVVGVAIAAVLAVVLFVGTGTGSSGLSTTQQLAAQDTAPGINVATAQLLSLTIFPSGAAKPAPDFTLTDQRGDPVSMSALRGKVVIFSPNDDRCQDLCTLLANSILAANQDLGTAAKDVVWLSVNANPFYPAVSDVATWTDQHGLGSQANWDFTTGSPAQLAAVWKQYGFEVEQDAATRTVNHSVELFYIDPSGQERAVADFGTAAANTALYAHGLAQVADDLLPPAQQVKVAGPETPAPTAHNATVGAVAPAFSDRYLTGGTGTLSSAALRGHYTVLNFWSSTCTVCRTELPALEASYHDTGGKVSFVGVDVADQPAAGRALLAAAGVTYPTVSDPGGTTAGSEAITGLPFTVIVDASGHVLVRHPGTFTTEQLDYLLQSDVPGLSPSS
jgi:cytochrome oxidase Cu insertion factor (SCO1/SenC/PrrC family)